MTTVRPRDRLSVQVDPDADWYASPEGQAYRSRKEPEPAEPRTWTPYPTTTKGPRMGYKRKRKIYKLVFEDPDMEGLVVRARSTSVQQFLDIQAFADAAKETDGDTVAAMKRLFATFATVIIDWNLEEEDGTPIEATAGALLAEDFDFAMAMVSAWLEAVAGVSAPVGKGSTPGSPVPLLEGSLQMETLSTSLTS